MPNGSSNASISSKGTRVLQPNQSAEVFARMKNIQESQEITIYQKSVHLVCGNEDYPLGDSASRKHDREERANSDERTEAYGKRSISNFTQQESELTFKPGEKDIRFKNGHAISYGPSPQCSDNHLLGHGQSYNKLANVVNTSTSSVKKLENQRGVASQQELSTDQLSNSVRETEEAPSNLGHLAIEQQGVVMVTISDAEGEDEEVETPRRSKAAEPTQFDGQSPVYCSPPQATTKQTVVARSQAHPNVISSDSNLITIKEDYVTMEEAHHESLPDSRGLLGSKVAVESDYTEKNEEVAGQQRIKSDKDIKKESVNAISSNDSHQHTRSAVDKGNFEQQCTDPSDGKANRDSQQSSAVSQYFQQLVADEEQKEINEDLCLNGINSDLIHLVPGPVPSYTQAQVFTAAELQECSKESSSQNINDLSSVEMIQSKSLQNATGGANSLDGDQNNVASDQLQRCSQDVLAAGNMMSAAHTSSLPKLLEKTPQFHGSSPIILEQPTEEDNTIEHTQYPNYESDAGGITLREMADPAPPETNLTQPSGRNRQVQTQNEEEKKQPPLVSAPELKGAAGPSDYSCSVKMINEEEEKLQSNHEFVLHSSLRILPGSDGYDPGICSESDCRTGKMSHENLLKKGTIDQDQQQVQPEHLIITQETTQELMVSDPTTTAKEEPSSSLGKNQSIQKDDRYKIQKALTNSMNDYQSHQLSRDTKLDGIMRGSSRFSKGHQVELDKVAERINNPMLLNSESHTEGTFPAQRSSQQRSSQPQNQTVEPPQSLRQSMGRQSQESSELPKGATQQKKQSQKKHKRKSTIENAQRAAMNCRELSSPAVSDHLHTRRRSRMGQPEVPDPVEAAEEARQRYSTPRHGSNKSPISNDRSTKSRKSRRSTFKSTYPVAIGKNRVITGPVLKSHYEKSQSVPATVGNKLKVLKRRKNTADQMMITSEETQVGLTSSNVSMSARQKVATKETIKRSTVSQDSHQPEHTSVILLPKKKIKTKRQLNSTQENNDLSVSRDRSQLPRKPRVPRINTLKRRKESKKKSGDNRLAMASIFQQRGHTSEDRQISTDNDFLSSVFKAEEVHFDKKGQPVYPQPVTIGDSSIDYIDSTQTKTFAGVSQQAISSMPIDQIYSMMSKNWTKEKVMFERKCQKVMESVEQHDNSLMRGAGNQMINEQAKNRQQRFDILRQRLLQNSEIRNKRTSSKPNTGSTAMTNIDGEYAQIKEKLKDLESVLSANQDPSTSQDRQNMGKTQPVQFGQFQFIFNKPEELFLPPSPTSGLRFKLQSTSHQSQVQIKRNPGVFFSNQAKDSSRQKSQVLTPGGVAGTTPATSNHQYSAPFQPIYAAINTSPQNFSSFIRQPASNKVNNLSNAASMTAKASAERQNNLYQYASSTTKQLRSNPLSGNATAINFHSPNTRGVVAPPQIQDIRRPGAFNNGRAATANNFSRHRKPGLVDALSNNGVQLQSSDHVGQGNPSILHRKGTISPTVITTDTTSMVAPPIRATDSQQDQQQRLMQKLQYRSMRGRRIKEYLAQVKSQRIAPNQHSQTPSQHQQNLLQQQQMRLGMSEGGDDEQSVYGVTSGNINVHSQISDSTVQRGVVSNNSFSLPPDDYGVMQTNRMMNGFKSDTGEILAVSETGSLNQLESKGDNSWILNSTHDERGLDDSKKFEQGAFQIRSSASGADGETRYLTAQSPNTQSAVLNNFLAQQDKRVDFGICQLYSKVKDSVPLDFDNAQQQKLLTLADLDNLITFIKRKNQKPMTQQFLIKTHEDCFNTIFLLLSELGMAYRAARMQRDESQINLERVYVLVCRAHKLQRARIELINIFEQIVKFEEQLPRLKSEVIRHLAGTGSRMLSSQNSSELTASMLDASQRADIERHAKELRTVLSQLVLSIPRLLEKFKFFNDSFVFNDKDYLKYLSKEANEIKGLLNLFNIRF